MIFNFPIKVVVCNLSSFEMQMWEFFNKKLTEQVVILLDFPKGR